MKTWELDRHVLIGLEYKNADMILSVGLPLQVDQTIKYVTAIPAVFC
jgi:hypothetical protein